MKLLAKITQIFRKPIQNPEPDVLFPGLVTAKQYAAFKPAQRMQAVMIVGAAADVKHYSFLKWCVENDLDLNVRFAALKRLPNFHEQKDLQQFLTQLDLSSNRSILEPYLSMALHRTGLIKENELKSRLNDG
ncbi:MULTISPECIES: hypothetical protein [Niastella]|uniref:HEAT repeat domain-containing protein n=1 Tax=Niastella soli TaxID=2821487 RepID=A0ABS3YNJ7_9BACT|nr:hypothetical protein [Niastella soli]MBO9199419.1 hypothetical protein [Niastella soli]